MDNSSNDRRWAPRLPPGASGWHATSPCRAFAACQATFLDAQGNQFCWTARAHRKGRYPELLHTPFRVAWTPPPRLAPIWPGYPFRDLSYWVALAFTAGCIAWVVNGHYALYSHRAVVAGSRSRVELVASVAALVGGTLFEGGSWLLYSEALNQPAATTTGKQLVQQQQDQRTHGPLAGQAASHDPHGWDTASSGAAEHGIAGPKAQAPGSSSSSFGSSSGGSSRGGSSNGGSSSSAGGSSDKLPQTQAPQLLLCPMANERPRALRRQQQQQLSQKQGEASSSTHTQRWFGLRLDDLGFVACLLQLIGATMFWVPCVFGAPRVYAPERITNFRTYDGVYWGFQALGGCFFVTSSWLFMLEEQPAWWAPRLRRVGWWVGLWNLVGSVGFLLCGIFGFLALPRDLYQLGGTVASTFWGSYAFLIGSYLQLLEAVNKHPESLQLCCWGRPRRPGRRRGEAQLLARQTATAACPLSLALAFD